MANEAKIKIAIELNEADAARVVAGVNKVADATDKVGKTSKTVRLGEQFGKDVDEVSTKVRTKLNPAILETKNAIKIARAESALLRKQVAADIDDLVMKQIDVMRSVSGNIQAIGQSALLTGGAVTGGIFLAAKNYIKDAKQADELTRQWASATTEIEQAQRRIGRVAAQTVLPFLEKAAVISSRVSSFVEKHPEIVEAAFNTGLLVAGFGALSIAVSRGIKLLADVRYLTTIPIQLTAAKMQDAAADKQLLAAQLRLKELGVDVALPNGPPKAPAGGIGTKLGTVALYATSVLISAELGVALGNVIGKAITGGKTGLAGPGGFGLGDAIVGTGMLAQTPAFLAIQGLNKVGLASDDTVESMRTSLTELDRFVAGLIGANKILNVIENLDAQKIKEKGNATGVAAVSTLGTSVATSANMDEIIDAFIKFKQDEITLAQDHSEKIKDITKERFEAEREAHADYAKKMNDIMRDMRASIQKTLRSATRADAEAERRLQEQDAKALQDFNLNRQREIENANADIIKIQEQLQEKLRKLEMEHVEKRTELLAGRDAVALTRERQRYNRAVSEAHREASLEIRERRIQLAARLKDLRENYERERAERHSEYLRAKAERAIETAERLAEIRAEAAQRRKEAADAHTEAIKQIREQAIEKLNDENRLYNEERKRLYDNFIQRIRDLDSALLGETRLRQQYYQQMLVEVDAFLSAYRSKLKSIGSGVTSSPFSGVTGTAGTKARGGYAPYGLYWLGDKSGGGKGDDEFVMDGRTTRAAEGIVRGRLSQQAILAAMMGGRGASVTLNDHRRFDSRISAEDRRDIMNDTLTMISKLV